MTWVLLWVFLGNDGASSGSQEFNTKEACIAGASEMKKAGFMRFGVKDVITCVPKGKTDGIQSK